MAWSEGTNNPTPTQLRVKELVNGTCTPIGGELNANVKQGASHPRIMDIGGAPIVTWSESNGSAVQIRAAQFTGGQWTAVGASLNDDPTQNAQNEASTSIGGVPYVTWSEGGNPALIRAARLQPDFLSQSATPTATGATLSAIVRDYGLALPIAFEYGTTASLGTQTGLQNTAGAGTFTVTQTLTGLPSSTAFFWRPIGSDTIRDTGVGPTQTFTTLAASSGSGGSGGTGGSGGSGGSSGSGGSGLPGPPTAKVNFSTVGPVATLAFTCQGAAGQTCTGIFSVTAHEHKLRTAVTAVTAAVKPKPAAVKPKPAVLAVTLGSGAYSVAAGSIETITFKLPSTFAKQLAKLYKEKVTFTFTATSGSAIPSEIITFSYFVIQAPISFLWTFGSSFTTVGELTVTGVPRGGTVAVDCHGGGCPFSHKSSKGKSHVALARLFGKARLRPGTAVRISITAPNSVGKVVTFTINSSAPREVRKCLPPGARKPVRCA